MNTVAAFRLYFKLVSASLRAQMQYKVDFLVSLSFQAALQAVDFALLAAIMLRFPEIAGWNIYEVGLLYGTASIALSLYRTIAPELHDFDRYIVQGTFDSLLIRPWPTLMVLLSRNLDLQRLGGALQGALIFGISARRLAAEGAIGSMEIWIMAALALVGTLIPFSLALITASCAFWFGRSADLQTFTMFAPITASQYPLTIYPGWLRTLLLSILPVGFINYIPIRFLLGKGGSWWSLAASPVAAAAAFLVAYSFWSLGHRHYHSAGS